MQGTGGGGGGGVGETKHLEEGRVQTSPDLLYGKHRSLTFIFGHKQTKKNLDVQWLGL